MFTRKAKITCLCLVILAGLYMLGKTSKSMNVSYDSRRYIVAGDSFANMKIAEGFNVVAPHHAPLYSMIIGLLGMVGFSNAIRPQFDGFEQKARHELTIESGGLTACRVLSVLGFMALVAGVFMLGYILAGEMASILAALSLLMIPAVTETFTWCWSEVLFLPLVVFALLALVLYRRKPAMNLLVIGALFCFLCFLDRLLGLVVIAAWTLILIIEEKHRRRLLVFLGIALAPLVLYLTFYSHRQIVGADAGLSTHMMACIDQIGYDIGIVGSLIAFAAVLEWKRMPEMALFIGTYMIALVVVESFIHIDVIDFRLMSPVYPLFAVLIGVTLDRMLSKNSRRRDA